MDQHFIFSFLPVRLWRVLADRGYEMEGNEDVPADIDPGDYGLCRTWIQSVLPIMRRHCSNFQRITAALTIGVALYSGRIDVVEELYTPQVPRKQLIMLAIFGRHLHCIEWVLMHVVSLNDSAGDLFNKGDLVEIGRYATAAAVHSLFARIPLCTSNQLAHVMYGAACSGHLQTLRLLDATFKDRDDYLEALKCAICSIYQTSSAASLAWFHEKDVLTETIVKARCCELMNRAIRLGRVDVCSWVQRHYPHKADELRFTPGDAISAKEWADLAKRANYK